ncbi:MAG: TolB-like protein [Lysobacterales bacterium]|jgi:TolB-like protein
MNEAVSPIRRLIMELRRRRVFRTAAIYIVSSWLVMQVGDVTFPALDIPERALRYVLFALLAGFPAALVFGWFYDVGPGGIRRTPQTGPTDADGSEPLRKSDFVVLTALLAVVAAIVYNMVGNVVEEPGVPTATRPDDRSGPPVIAVLPFTTTSLESESEFFAAGVHDDLLTQLSKLESIRVISRTSVLEYRDITRNLREIGAELGADVILEGGVQVAGEQIRINAQLIDTRTDEHLWAETYNRSLTAANIFDVQQEIARAISTAMHTTLTEQDKQALSAIPTENMAAYRAYRKAMANRGRNGLSNDEREELLKEAVDLDPKFVRAWAELVGLYSMQGFSGGEESVQMAEEALEQVRILKSDSAEYLIAQSYYVYYVVKDYDQAHGLLTQAMARSPSDVNLLELKSWIERRQGDFEAKEETIRSMVKLDPRNPNARRTLATHLVQTHQYDAALEAIGNFDADPWLLGWSELIQLKDDNDYDRLLDNVKILVEGREESLWVALWYAYVLKRQYSDAVQLLERVEKPDERFRHTLWNWEEIAILTYWFMDDQSKLDELLPEARSYMESLKQDDGSFSNSASYLSLALVAAAEGNAEETLQLFRGWQELNRDDWAGRITQRDRACPLLGMVGATTAAVNCIRLGMQEPSYIFPFQEVYSPFYDPIRDEPEFIELIAEIDGIYEQHSK